MTPNVTINERLAEFIDEDGNFISVRCLVGEIPVPELGCIVTYAVEMPEQRPESPERMEMLKDLVRQGALAELDKLQEERT